MGRPHATCGQHPDIHSYRDGHFRQGRRARLLSLKAGLSLDILSSCEIDLRNIGHIERAT